MWFGLDPKDLGLIGIIFGIFVLRAMVPSITRRMFPKRSAPEKQRAWTWFDMLAIGLAVAFVGMVWLQRPGSLAPVVGGIGIALAAKAVKGLLALRSNANEGRTGRPTKS